MQCPKCQSDNREGIKFCEECGARFEIKCPTCKAKIPHGKKFCGECGNQLDSPVRTPSKEISFNEMIEKIQRYLPLGITEKILSQRDNIEGERKHVTVMFCDLEGFTSIVENLGSEEAYNMMDLIYEILIHKVHEYEGTVNEMTGDGIMALFGAPIALEDAPQRAIRAGLAIHREISKFSDAQKDEKIPLLKMRIGIHSGPVVVGTLGNDLRVDFKAVGDTVNLASRLEGLAEPGTTYVTEDTFKLTEGLFRFEALGEKEVKGKKDKVRCFRVIATSSRRTRFDVSAERGLTPFVGKERELEQLLDGFELSKSSRGRAFSISAEAGVGKSRLLYEFRKAVLNESVNFIESKCLSYGRNMAYHPIIDILKSTFNIADADNDDEIRQKITPILNTFGVDEASTLPYFLELMSVSDSGIEQIAMSPEGKKAQIIKSLKRIVLKGSEMLPLIIVIEDLHWIDASSEDVLKDLLSSIPGARILLIFTYRTEYSPPWSGKSYHSQVTLNRLSNRESSVMVTNLLGSIEIDGYFENLILDKTEGIPFFIEEFIKSLKDLNTIEVKDNKYYLAKDIQEMSLPSTIHDVIMTRIDSLPEEAKQLLQTGSVIEREFSYKLIKQATSLSQEELLRFLSAIKDAELLYERGIYPESTYIFKHALTREVVYDSILSKRKRVLHEEIGNSIEDLYKDNLNEYYGVLAEHFICSENYEKGAEYSSLAGRNAEKGASFVDAISYSEKRIACLEKLPVSETLQKKIIDSRVSLGLYLSQLGRLAEAKKAIDPIIEVASKVGYQKRLSQIYTIIGFYNCNIEEDLTKARRHLEEALRISKDRNDVVSLFFASYWLSVALYYNCEFESSISHIKTALDINKAINILWGVVAMKCQLSLYYNYQGNIDLGYQTSHEALSIAEESDDIYSKAWAYTFHGSSCVYKGYLEEAVDCLLKGIDLSERLDFFELIFLSRFSLVIAYSEIGEYEKAKDHCDKLLFKAELAGVGPSRITYIKTCLALVKTLDNKKDICLETLFDNIEESKLKIFEIFMRSHIGEILLNIDDMHMSKGEDYLKKVIETSNRYGMTWLVGRNYALYAELFKGKDKHSKAKETLEKAVEIFKECGADGWVERYEKVLVEL